MPVKINEAGLPLGAPPPVPAPVETPPAQAPKAAATDQLLQSPPPAAAQVGATGPEAQLPVVAQASTGFMDKGGVITKELLENILTGMTVPASYAGAYGKVTYGLAATINTGNFENLRPFVQIEVPYIPGAQDAVYDFAFDWVDARLTGVVAGIKQNLKGE